MFTFDFLISKNFTLKNQKTNGKISNENRR